MKKLTHSLCIMTGVLALAAGACSSSPGSTTGTGGSGGSGSAHPDEILLNITTTGYAMDTTTGIIGALYAYADSVGPNASVALGDDNMHSDCVMKGGFQLAQCTQVLTPTPGQPFAADATGKFCTSGVAAKVLNGANGMPDYSDMWGGGMGMDLNNPGGDAGVKMDWNGSAYAGMAFDISPGAGASGAAGIASSSMRVNFPFTGEHGTDSPYSQGALKSNSALPINGDHVRIMWTDVGGPMYLGSSGVTPPAFDPTKIQSIQWQVFTGTSSTTPYNFCISNLSVIKK
jgi:hypothetical protein